MSKHGELSSVAPLPSKPPGRKNVELPRAVRPPPLVSSASAHLRRKSKGTSSPKTSSGDDNNNSPHTNSRDSEPATDEDSPANSSRSNPSDPIDLSKYSQLETSERQAVAMLNKITKKSERNHQKYDAFRDNISGKDEQVKALHASFEDLARQTVCLEALGNSDLDGDTLEKLFLDIPLQQRQLYLGE